MKELKELQASLNEIERIKKALKAAILSLPDNPRLQRISNHPRCFTMSSKDVFAPNKYGFTDMRIKNNLSVFFHDFKAQYEKLAEVVEKARPENVLPSLQAIIANGRTEGRDYNNFHPDVIANLKAILEA